MTASKKGGVQTQMAGEGATGSVLERASAVSALRDPGLMAASLMTWPADDLRRFARLREDISKNAISFKAGVVKCMLLNVTHTLLNSNPLTPSNPFHIADLGVGMSFKMVLC